jgi:fructokinase
MKKEILCIGEVLWDALPSGLFPGGAPFNVACHLRMLGERVAIASCVGDDVLGEEAVRRLVRRGMDPSLIRIHPTLPTGFVRAELDADGDARYEIVEPAAWDAIEVNDAMTASAAKARAVVFGSLAQRHATSRESILQLVRLAAFSVFDVNLRPPYDKPEIVEESLHDSDLVKLNGQELLRLSEWFGLPGAERTACEAVASRFGCHAVVVTRGAAGAALWREGRWTEHPGIRTAVRDTIGAGDAFLAALLFRLIDGCPDSEALRFANEVGAFVASRDGATPEYRVERLHGRWRLGSGIP